MAKATKTPARKVAMSPALGMKYDGKKWTPLTKEQAKRFASGRMTIEPAKNFSGAADIYQSIRETMLNGFRPIAGYTLQHGGISEPLYFKDPEAASKHMLKMLALNPRATITVKPIYTAAE